MQCGGKYARIFSCRKAMVEWRSGSAGALQAQGRGFKSLLDHHRIQKPHQPMGLFSYLHQKSGRQKGKPLRCSWCPLEDSNLRCRPEKPVSLAARRRGRAYISTPNRANSKRPRHLRKRRESRSNAPPHHQQASAPPSAQPAPTSVRSHLHPASGTSQRKPL